MQAQRIFKVVMVGDSGVGKTTFVRHLSAGRPPGDVPMTVGESRNTSFYQKDSLAVATDRVCTAETFDKESFSMH